MTLVRPDVTVEGKVGSMQLPSFFNDFTLPPLEWHQQMREWGATMRATQPVWFDEKNKNWRIFRYANHLRVQNDYVTFSSAPTPHEGGAEAANSIIAMDPPRHRQLRSLVTQAFSARTIAQLAPRIEEIARELLLAMGFTFAWVRRWLDWR
ncbi:hypothetical protein KSZ_77440 [Dictyobacter formicarum]|uniref:Cytochrome P450 n=2 Tax=Dictyobacter formicarum TaxID=2778368 RepID=A0ABQ3VVZ0_9CHLR|nr:hypothetical protein KSZ_77440 [Dictyobacter formicarum]